MLAFDAEASRSVQSSRNVLQITSVSSRIKYYTEHKGTVRLRSTKTCTNVIINDDLSAQATIHTS